MARQYPAGGGLPGLVPPIYVNETGSRQYAAPGVYVTETSGGTVYNVSVSESGAASDSTAFRPPACASTSKWRSPGAT